MLERWWRAIVILLAVVGQVGYEVLRGEVVFNAPSAVMCMGAAKCDAMASCEQAYACLRDGQSSLDRDKDGVPCESICPGG